MAVSTTQSIWRSGGGDQTRTAYCGTGLMVAQFYIADITAANTTKVVVSSTNSSNVILPVNAVITSINITATTSSGGTAPTIDMGFTLYTTGTTSGQSLLNEQPSDAKATATLSTSTKGTSLGAVMSSSELVYITGGVGASAATSGTVTGFITYFVVDPNGGQQVV
jgi:hypothetical protein